MRSSSSARRVTSASEGQPSRHTNYTVHLIPYKSQARLGHEELALGAARDERQRRARALGPPLPRQLDHQPLGLLGEVGPLAAQPRDHLGRAAWPRVGGGGRGRAGWADWTGLGVCRPGEQGWALAAPPCFLPFSSTLHLAHSFSVHALAPREGSPPRPLSAMPPPWACGLARALCVRVCVCWGEGGGAHPRWDPRPHIPFPPHLAHFFPHPSPWESAGQASKGGRWQPRRASRRSPPLST
jgi:hypothetical protein